MGRRRHEPWPGELKWDLESRTLWVILAIPSDVAEQINRERVQPLNCRSRRVWLELRIHPRSAREYFDMALVRQVRIDGRRAPESCSICTCRIERKPLRFLAQGSDITAGVVREQPALARNSPRTIETVLAISDACILSIGGYILSVSGIFRQNRFTLVGKDVPIHARIREVIDYN